MPDDSLFDLSTATAWHGLSPGMSRADALAALAAAGAETDEDANDPGWMLAVGGKWGVELMFEEAGAQRLRQIALDDEGGLWGGRAFMGRPLHEALAVLGEAATGAGWRPEDATAEPFADLKPAGPGPFTDVELLCDGTVWLPRRGLGLVMCGGTVNELIWRRAEEVPRELVGPVTATQREITARADLEDYLRDAQRAARGITRQARANPLQRILNFMLVAGLGLVGWKAWQEVQLWKHAPRLTGRLVSIEKVEAKPWRDIYNVRFNDPAGRERTVGLVRGDFDVAPREAGEEVQVAYVAGEPPRVMESAHAKDAAFLPYVTWAMMVALLYTVGSLAAAMIWRRLAVPRRVPRLPQPPGLRR